MPAKANLPAIPTPEGVPEWLSSVVAHYDGYPVIEDDDGIPIAAISHFLRTKVSSNNTRLAYRDDIYAFIVAIAARGLSWDSRSLSTSDFVAYRNMLLKARSRHTGRTREVSTVQRRLAGLRKFYMWARGAGHVHAEFDWEQIQKIPADIVKSLAEREHKNNLSGGDNREKRYISPDHAGAILDALGPRTDTNWKLDCFFDASMRYRLAAEFSLHTGARVDEVAHLTVMQVPVMRDFNSEEVLDDRFSARMAKRGSFPIRLTWTKRLEPRTVRAPADLVWWLNWYVQVERKKILERALNRLGSAEFTRRDLSQTPWLWLNGLSEDCPDNRLGTAMSEKLLGRKFTEAVVSCGLTKSYYGNGGNIVEEKKPIYTFHDLRHTFAIFHYLMKYRQLRGQHDAETSALTYVQLLLGHRNIETTRNHYVKLARLMSLESDRVYQYQNNILRPQK